MGIASPRELIHQSRRGLSLNRQIDAHHSVDGLNELRVRERGEMPTTEIVTQLTATA